VTTEQAIERPPSSQAEQPVADRYTLALRASLAAMPYNSATAFHTSFGDGPPDPRFGMACIYQTIDAARRAQELGAPAPLFLQDERHVGAVFHDDGDVIVLDPYLLHVEAVRFPRVEVLAGESSVRVEAASRRQAADGQVKPGRLDARYKATADGYVIRLSYSRFGPRRGSYVISRHFSLRPASVFDMQEFSKDMRSLVTDPEQTSVSIRAFIPEVCATAEAIIPLHGYARKTFSSRDIWLRSGQGVVSRNGEAGSGSVWEQVTGATTLSQSDIEDHLLGAARIYQRIADPSKDVAPYSLDNE
jgi:hypothetical protein